MHQEQFTPFVRLNMRLSLYKVHIINNLYHYHYYDDHKTFITSNARATNSRVRPIIGVHVCVCVRMGEQGPIDAYNVFFIIMPVCVPFRFFSRFTRKFLFYLPMLNMHLYKGQRAVAAATTATAVIITTKPKTYYSDNRAVKYIRSHIFSSFLVASLSFLARSPFTHLFPLFFVFSVIVNPLAYASFFFAAFYYNRLGLV